MCLEKKTLIEQLIQLTQDNYYPAEFYGTCIPDHATRDFIQTLDKELRSALLIKLRGKQRGPWAAFKRILRELDGPT